METVSLVMKNRNLRPATDLLQRRDRSHLSLQSWEQDYRILLRSGFGCVLTLVSVLVVNVTVGRISRLALAQALSGRTASA